MKEEAEKKRIEDEKKQKPGLIANIFGYGGSKDKGRVEEKNKTNDRTNEG